MITTRYNQAAAEPFLFTATPSSSLIAPGVNPQLKKAIALRDRHSGGCPANESKVPAAQDVTFAMARVSNPGNWTSSETKNVGEKVHGAVSRWNSRTEAVRNSSKAWLQSWGLGHRKEKEPLPPDMQISHGVALNLTMVIGANTFWTGVGVKVGTNQEESIADRKPLDKCHGEGICMKQPLCVNCFGAGD